MIDRLRRQPEEVLFFGRSAVFALAVATVYWFISYEPAGTTLLGLFGVASAFAAILLARGQRRAGPATDPQAIAGGPFADESGRVPAETFAPLQVGSGLAIAGLGLVFGPWLILAGLLPIALGAVTWLGSAGAELEATEHSDTALADGMAGLPPVDG
jgi:hypothetical protein